MKLDFNTVFMLVGGIVTLFGIVAIILAAPGAKRPKHKPQ
jgi:hypothetical protein